MTTCLCQRCSDTSPSTERASEREAEKGWLKHGHGHEGFGFKTTATTRWHLLAVEHDYVVERGEMVGGGGGGGARGRLSSVNVVELCWFEPEN
jgi:hypothetical protein